MADDTKVSPTPIQRNEFDVAMELLRLYSKTNMVRTGEEIEKAFMRFYSIAKSLNSMQFTSLVRYLPEDMQEIVKEYE